MTYQDLSIKAKFDVAVMHVLGAPSTILSDEYEKDGQRVFLEFKKNADYAGFCGRLVNESVSGSFFGVSKVSRNSVDSVGLEMVGIDAIEGIIESWQDDMRDSGWVKREISRVGSGAEYKAVSYAYNKDVSL